MDLSTSNPSINQTPTPTRDILTNPPAFPASPATTTLFTNPPTTPIQTIQTYETPDRQLTGIRVTWMNGDRARLGVCGEDLGTSTSTSTSTGIGTGISTSTGATDSGSGAGAGVGIGNTSASASTGAETGTGTGTGTEISTSTKPQTIRKTFAFDRQERIQIMYVYVGSTQVDGFWFVTNKQKSFFPGRSSERREMSDLGSGVLVGMEGREKLDEEGRVEGILGLGVSFRR
ncbi:hypothetical protein P170DRAFT_514130 [Aspergillus steynii IBT 23096]|uniref:Jacalin-type lectin domain-containing protein n=1 Tax=Aspergillus steynii IBT 23096 TaxID=1392250 RepID=A0A2I2FT72_9EURO|nr:uncharacterized protein P170DRAFT_514130 [Aspergillus steynii IBT 23096]PLB43814.1 hypothetical protein P170DRAFT_514130 [Aspergillus steynii IBT 23096]